MSLDAAQRRQLVEVFRDEAAEGFRNLTRHLITCEQADSAEERQCAYDDARKLLHSLKGSAGAVGLTHVQTVLHDLESTLSTTTIAAGRPPHELIDAALVAIDEAEGWIRRETAADSDPTPVEPGAATAPGSEPGVATVAVPAMSANLKPTEGTAASTALVPGDVAAQPESSMVRVATERLDALLGHGEEMIVATAHLRPRIEALRRATETVEHLFAAPHLSELATTGLADAGAADRRGGEVRPQLNLLRQHLAGLVRDLSGDHERMSTLATGLLEGIRATRMLPVGSLFDTFHRPVRDLARQQQKSLQLEVQCEDVRLDKRALDVVGAPLLHLLRNAVGHGIEPPAERISAGKPPFGKIVLSAEQRGSRVVLQVRDDGRGIREESIREAAVRLGFLKEADAGSLSGAALLDLIFRPGFSTAKVIDNVSGRGVGLAVVRENVHRLHGEVVVESVPGGGTCFSLSLPLTIAATRGLLVRAGRETFALPVPMVVRVLRVTAADVFSLQGRPAIDKNMGPTRLVDLAALLDVGAAAGFGEGARAVVVIASSGQRLALGVDAVVDEREIIMRDLPGALSGIDILAGATILDDGRVVPVLNVEGLCRAATDRVAALVTDALPTTTTRRKQRIVVADDSAATRLLIASEIEAAGFEVAAAADGREALALLEGSETAALVSDVSMPNLDGVALVSAVRAHATLANLPVILVTSLDSDSDRQRGAAAGADAYLIKREFTGDKLVEVLGQLLRRSGAET
jgi:two-component system, chemotaxis family, sensor kinase CheA